MNEFSIIKEYFQPLCDQPLDNDAAVLTLPEGHELVVTSDTLNAGTHFMMGSDPAHIAHKALRVNLSDLAAMGAAPLSYQLNIAFPEKPSAEWLESFTNALKADQNEFGISCSGGDTTSINGPLSISITALGSVPQGQALQRNGAQDRDAIILIGQIGGAYLGLEILRGNINIENPRPYLDAYHTPYPYLKVAPLLRVHVHAAIDVSDGFAADLGHLCKASDLGAMVNTDDMAFTADAASYLPIEKLITGGDDYALLLAVSPEKQDVLTHEIQAMGYSCTHIGHFTNAHKDIRFTPDVKLEKSGWTHF